MNILEIIGYIWIGSFVFSSILLRAWKHWLLFILVFVSAPLTFLILLFFLWENWGLTNKFNKHFNKPDWYEEI